MSKLLKFFLAFAGFLGLSTIAFCSFILFSTNSNNTPTEILLGTKIIQCGKDISPSDTFWTQNRFK